MTEMERLEQRLFDTPDKRLVHFHVSWGPKAHLMTPEARAAAINAAFDAPGEEIFDVDNYNTTGMIIGDGGADSIDGGAQI